MSSNSALDSIASGAGVELFEGLVFPNSERNVMSILNSDPVNYPGSAANMLRQSIRNLFAQMRAAGIQGYNMIWRNPNASPSEVLAALGTDAEEVFAMAALNLETLTQAATIGGATPPAIGSIPDNYSLTFGSDGMAILTELESSSSSSSSSDESSSSSSEPAPKPSPASVGA